MTLLFLSFANGFGYGSIQPVLILFVRNEFSLTSEATVVAMGLVFTIAALPNIVLQVPAGKLADAYDRKKILLYSVLGVQAFTFLIPFSRDMVYLGLAVTLRSVALAFMSPSFSSMQEDIMPRAVRGRLTGLMDTALNLGAAPGPILGLWALDSLSKEAPFYLSALILLVAASAFGLFGTNPKREEAEL